MSSEYLEFANGFLMQESAAIARLPEQLGESFVEACRRIIACRGRVIWMGVGQSWHVARKTSCSMASLGRPSFYVHATEAVHGDMGLITGDDVVILISHSGRTKEVVDTLGPIRTIGAQTIAIVGNPDSKLGEMCDVVLTTGVKEEAGPYKFAPSSSALATTALGDALVMTVADAIGFTADDYARYHPGGSAGEDLAGQSKGS
jgi:arabinose-5-phosphate isomerase